MMQKFVFCQEVFVQTYTMNLHMGLKTDSVSFNLDID